MNCNIYGSDWLYAFILTCICSGGVAIYILLRRLNRAQTVFVVEGQCVDWNNEPANLYVVVGVASSKLKALKLIADFDDRLGRDYNISECRVDGDSISSHTFADGTWRTELVRMGGSMVKP